MRGVACLLLVPVLAFLLAAHWEIDAESAAAPADDLWRHTEDGWEKAAWLMPPSGPPRHALHPMVPGMLILLVSLAALVAFPQGAPSSKPSGSVPPRPKFRSGRASVEADGARC